MNRPQHFNLLARLLHWAMAIAIVTMLFVGAGMVVSLQYRTQLLALHRPLGIAILLLAIVRLVNRLTRPTPALPSDLPAIQKFAAHASHWLLYALMLAMPVIGWAMLSAGGYPIPMFGGMHLPAIVPHSAEAYGLLRPLHGALAYLLFLTILGHLGAALFHAWVRRDEVFGQMAKGDSQ
ncbi:cytochrome b [Duganella aceris]|jgi:cytochrome b561|uniref:Cytochrome b n=1 Tax=Duganella aceris TaxID=2703883 RepID=A0ABX0FKW1_9BURK|nr:cytochrome b [Duganella aceris]NGZ85110.1 cytochrome b [Duganella aceris]